MLDISTLFLSLGSLLLLSIVTLIFCQRDKHEYSSERNYLFQGYTSLHSLTSNVGTVFSATWVFGAMIVYTRIYMIWSFLFMAAVFLTTWLLYRSILERLHKETPPHEEKTSDYQTHLLLNVLSKRTTKSEFQAFLGIWTFSHSLMLILELTVARIILQTLFPGFRYVPAILLFLILVVIYVYLYVGGFRAVLISDMVQTSVLAGFVLVCIYLIQKTGGVPKIIRYPHDLSVLCIFSSLTVFWLIWVAYIVGSADMYSRLNVVVPSDRLGEQRQHILSVSIASCLIVLIIACIFGLSVSSEWKPISSIDQHFANFINVFYSTHSPIIITIFMVSLFCMFFTTVDTSLLSLIQIGFRWKKIAFTRNYLLFIIVLATFVSCLIKPNALGTLGIFALSSFLLPCLVIMRLLYPSLFRWLPPGNGCFVGSILCAILILPAMYAKMDLRTMYELHGYIPLSIIVPLFSIVIIYWIWKYVKLLFVKLREYI